MSSIDFAALRARDQSDPLAHKRQDFHIPEDTVYLDGNSLGLMTHATAARVQAVVQQQWANDGIKSWNQHDWVNLPAQVGEKIAPLIGAAAGQVVCCDSISVNLFKVLSAALQLNPTRTNVISTVDNFPTDLYMVQGLSALVGEQQCKLVTVDEHTMLAQPQDVIDESTAVLLLTEVNFRTGRRLPVQELIAHAHKVGALVIVDLAHSAGAMPVTLDHWQADFAVGCTYKYLNGGPGAPAFVYVAERHQKQLRQPLAGWFGHAEPFAFDPVFRPADTIKQMLAGTPPVLAMSAVDAALEVFSGVDLALLREKSLALSELFLDLLDEVGLADEFDCISPAEPAQRGSQLSFAHADAYAICQALIEAKVIADFRAPNYLRIGFTPLYTSFTDVGIAVERLQSIMREETFRASHFQQRHAVT